MSSTTTATSATEATRAATATMNHQHVNMTDGAAGQNSKESETTTATTTGTGQHENDKWQHDVDRKISFRSENPHRKDTKSWEKYEKAKGSATVGAAKEMGISAWDLKEWGEKGLFDVGCWG